MKKLGHIITTMFIMLIVSRFLIRILDATGQIEGHFPLLLLVLIFINAAIGYVSYKLCRAKRK